MHMSMVLSIQEKLRIGPYRFLFYASDGDEPIHIHVLRDDNMVKFWIKPVRLAVNIGFSPKELREIKPQADS